MTEIYYYCTAECTTLSNNNTNTVNYSLKDVLSIFVHLHFTSKPLLHNTLFAKKLKELFQFNLISLHFKRLNC